MSLKNIKSFAAAVMVSAGAFVACVQMEDQNVAVGYLSAPSLEVDVVVDDLMQTKALDFDIEAPEISEIHYVVKDKDGNTKYDAVGLWAEPLVLPVGAYTIDAYHGENGFDAPYFKGSASGTISPLGIQTPTFSVSLENSLVNVTLDKEFEKHFIGEKVTMASGTIEKEFGKWFYVPSNSELILTLSGKNSAGKDATFTYSLVDPATKKPYPAAKTAYSVVCKATSTDWPTISLAENSQVAWASRIYITSPASFTGDISDANKAAVVYEAIPSSSSVWTDPATAVSENGVLVIKGLTPGTEYQVRARVGALVSPVVKVTPMIDGLSATANHTYTSGELDGTDVTSTFSKPDVVKNSIASWSINLCKADGTVLRRALPLGTSDGSEFTATNDWPYLPVGSYKLVAQATMKDGEVVDIEKSFSTNHPSFTVVPTCKTTYDYAQARDLNNANAVSGSSTANASIPSQSLFEIGSSVSIAPNLMCNTNYSKTVYYAAYKDSELVIATDGYVAYGTSQTHSLGDVHNEFTDWRSYLLSTKVNFAGTEYEGTKTFHITGLPYSAAPPKNTGDHPWSGSAQSWGNDYVRLHEHTIMQSFYCPANIDVSVYHKARLYTRADDCTYTLSLSGNTLYTKKQYSVGGSATNIDEWYNNASLSNANPTISASSSYGTVDFALEYTNVRIYSIQLE